MNERTKRLAITTTATVAFSVAFALFLLGMPGGWFGLLFTVMLASAFYFGFGGFTTRKDACYTKRIEVIEPKKEIDP